ncbi:MAG: AhpC/TSA family protein [Flavobacteriaceae bacterium]|nr:MAG: AhpC/TSA family protein [Flavobacteriaceae bacterium]
MRELQSEFNRLETRIIVVTFENNYFAEQYIQETGIEWPLLIDENRDVYRAYGMLQAGFWDIWGPSTWVAYLKELIKGRKLKGSTGDINQRGGDVLISPDGKIKLYHVGTGPADRPDARKILKIIKNNRISSH